MVNRSDLEVNVHGRDHLSPELQKIQSRLIRFVGAVSSALTAVRVASFPVNAVREFEKEMANVQKTTNFTDSQLKQLGDNLVDFSRKITLTAPELAKIAAAAGQQGLGREGVEGVEAFTESVARMSAVLDITVDDAATDIGKIASIFGIALADIETVVSSFNETANNSTASGEELLDVVKRIGNAAGSLRIDEAIGVAATGIDLGLSQEVSGTSFSKIFAEMFAQADEFARLLGVSTTEWMDTLQKGGVDALKAYLGGLRKLSQEDQQKWIKALSGGGRIGVLVTKLLQDVNNTILDRNLGFSSKGLEEGTSAIKEQQTVLATLDAQIKETSNSFQALGIKAGEQFAGELAVFFAQLNAGLADDDVIAFAEAVGETFLDIFQIIADGIKIVASLNINWENFLTLAKGLFALKVASFFTNKLALVGNLGTAYKAAGAAATEGAKAEAAASAVSQRSLRSQFTEIKQLIVARAEYKKAIQEQSRLEVLAAEQSRALNLAAVKDQAARTALAQANTNIATSNPQVAAARAATVAAEKAAAQQVETVRAQAQAKLQAAEQKHQARLQLIAAEYEAKRQAAASLGSKALLRDAQEEAVLRKTQEDAYFARSLRSTEAYYARRLQLTQAAGVAEVAAAKLAFDASLARFSTTVAAQNLSGLQAHLAATGTKLQFVSKELDGTLTRLNALRASTAGAVTALKSLQVGLALLGRGFNLLIGVLSKAFFWFTLIYTVLDITGLLSKVGGALQGLTDFLGLSSEAAREKARADELLAEKLEKVKEAADEAAEAVEKYTDKLTRGFDKSVSLQLELNFTDPDAGVVNKAIDEYLQILEVADTRAKDLLSKRQELPSLSDGVEKDLAVAKERLQEYQEDVALIQEAIKLNVPADSSPDSFVTPALEEAQAAMLEQIAVVEELEQKLSNVGPAGEAAFEQARTSLDEFNKGLDELTRKAQTQTSANVIAEFGPQIVAARERVELAQEEVDRLTEEAKKIEGREAREAAEEEIKLAVVQVEVARKSVADIKKALAEAIAAIKASGGLSAAIIGSLDFVPTYLDATNKKVIALLGSLDRVKKSGLPITGEDAPQPLSPNSGDRELKTKEEARKLSKARIDLSKAELQSIANLEKQHNSESERDLEDSYNRSLISIRDYYKARTRLAQDNVDIELRERRAELAALQSEAGERITEADKIRGQADIVRVRGAIDLLLAQREALVADNAIEEREALERFTDEAASQKQAILDFFGTTDTQQVFAVALENSARAHRETLERMEAEAKEHPDLLPYIDAIKLQINLEAVEAVFSNMNRQADIVNQRAENVERRLSLLQENGFVTFNEYAALLEENHNKQADQLEALIIQEEAHLEVIKKQNDAYGTQDIVIEEITNSIEARRVELEELRLEGNLVARELNEELHSALSGFLQELAHGKDISEALEDFGLRLLDSLVSNAADNLATTAMQALKTTGSGGFGGFFAGILGAGAERGTELNPMITREALADKGVDAAKGAAEDVTADVLGGGSTLANVGDKVEKSGEGVLGGIWGIGEDIVTGVGEGLTYLGGLLQTLFASLIGVIFSTSAAESSSGLVGMLGNGAASAALAHSGGVVGHLSMSRTGVNPAVFAQALRYHGGGLPGMSKDEVAAILLKGEEVLTKDDPRNILNGGKRGSTGNGSNQPILRQRLLPILDPDLISEALRGPQGEELVELIITRNPGKFNSILNRG